MPMTNWPRRGCKFPLTSALAAGCALLPLVAHTQGKADTAARPYPSQSIRLIVPFSPGGSTDIVGRVIGQKVAAALGQPIVVENKPGAGTTIGTAEAARAAPDGYTLLMISGAQLISPAIYKNLGFDLLESFTPIARVANSGLAMTVAQSVPAGNVKEFIALAKANPGTINYGSSGNGSNQHMGGALFAHFTGAPMTHIPYKGSAQVNTDLIAGRIQVSFMAIANALPLLPSGKVRVLAVTPQERWPSLPEVPTFTELGYPGVESGGWLGIITTRGTPPAIVNRLFEVLKTAFETDEVKAQLIKSGSIVNLAAPAEFAAIMRADSAKMLKIAASIGLTPN